MAWEIDSIDHFIMHQVSRIHTEALVNLLGLDPEKVEAIYPEMGNVGPASVPMTLARTRELGKLQSGDRVALMGIGSGLNCAIAELLW